ncbi:hypothetical protein Coch_0794 [Capnocytophaga ochracea DSM 7271]|uniref:Uncharacterized protein n=1 Tax=Capnocytophaga ochracea (strain ATCC 27872 / DSM 7271 / CCUG 9716 / JCM 12966 / NCTC 12371 / SS31 / VPI 2845) TaxID=521097 RepID=C7M905_CAPOD|nr:hypothetical protein Coch_0794 [Capnocytophaga ochracea DSM 7271]
MTEKGECSDGEAKETSPLSHTPLSRGTYPAVAGYLQRGKMWRIVYSVSPRTPEGGQAGKDDKPPPIHILRSRGLPFKGECSDGKGK